MAVHRFQVRLQSATSLPEDVFENVLYFSVDSPDTVQGCAEGIRDAYLNHAPISGVSTIEVRAYPLGGGQPEVIVGPQTATGLSGGTLPTEVALCLSYAAVDDVSASTARRRGRIYIGPIGAASPGDRPSSALQSAVLDLGEALAQIGFGANTTWVMYSPTDDTTAKIEAIWVDNAWDTQRRRGFAPTARTVRDVQ